MGNDASESNVPTVPPLVLSDATSTPLMTHVALIVKMNGVALDKLLADGLPGLQVTRAASE